MRYKEFNRNKVLDNCITLFWKNGYTGSSINEIVSKTGVNRFSLYNEFGDKEGILNYAIDLYKERYLSKKLEILKQKNPLREVLTDFYKCFWTDNNSHPLGCFIIHLATELADRDIKIKNILDNYMNELEADFINLLNLHQETSNNSQFYARHLTALFCTSMCFCLIQSYDERLSHLKNGISIILKKTNNYATFT